ncbi:MAG: CDP-alcohol phosphatidyltransferase family protein [Chloroflexota bacterium]
MKLQNIRKTLAGALTQSVINLLARTAITPNQITWFGLVLTLAAGVVIATGYPVVGGIIVLVGGFFDILDGALARTTQRTTIFGGVLDSTLDRVADAIPLLGILAIYAVEGSVPKILLVGVTLLGSFLVSYIRARAEGAGLECQVGIFTRTERVIILAVGLLLYRVNYALVTALVIMTLFSFITVGQRLVYVWRQTRKGNKSGRE